MSFRDLRLGVMKTQTSEKRFKLISILLSKMFYGHTMFIGGGSRYLSFPVYCCRFLWIQKLTSIWTTLYSHSVFNFYFFGKKNSPANVLTCTQTWSQLRSMDTKAGEYQRSELPGLDVTISAPYHWSVARQLTPFPLRHKNLRNLTLQQECYLTNTQAFFHLRMAL